MSGDIDHLSGEADEFEETELKQQEAAAVVVAEAEEARKKKMKKLKKILIALIVKTPGYVWLLGIFILGRMTVEDPRAAFVELGPYALSWVELIYALGGIVSMAELFRVSKPGVNNVNDALALGVLLIVYVILVCAGIAADGFLKSTFMNTEFLILTLLLACQAMMAFTINARTLQRTIGHAGHDEI